MALGSIHNTILSDIKIIVHINVELHHQRTQTMYNIKQLLQFKTILILNQQILIEVHSGQNKIF